MDGRRTERTSPYHNTFRFKWAYKNLNLSGFFPLKFTLYCEREKSSSSILEYLGDSLGFIKWCNPFMFFLPFSVMVYFSLFCFVDPLPFILNIFKVSEEVYENVMTM
jgi:hypothetical protein